MSFYYDCCKYCGRRGYADEHVPCMAREAVEALEKECAALRKQLQEVEAIAAYSGHPT